MREYATTSWAETDAPYLVGGSALYLVGTILVTLAFNVPLNDRLAKVAPGTSEAAEFWVHYLTRWNIWNHVRTAASLASAASFMGHLGGRGVAICSLALFLAASAAAQGSLTI